MMSRIINLGIIGFVALLGLVLLFFCIKGLLPEKKEDFSRRKGRARRILVYAIGGGILIALLWIFLRDVARPVYINPETTVVEAVNTVVRREQEDDNAIVLREDKILINGKLVTAERAEQYIAEHAKSGTAIVIVDDYCTAELHHQITRMCEESGVEYGTEDETWMQQTE